MRTTDKGTKRKNGFMHRLQAGDCWPRSHIGVSTSTLPTGEVGLISFISAAASLLFIPYDFKATEAYSMFLKSCGKSMGKP